jgi:hypothetical protein
LSNQPPLIATSMLSSIIVGSVGFAVSIVWAHSSEVYRL